MAREIIPKIDITSIEFYPKRPMTDHILFFRNAYKTKKKSKIQVPISERYTLSVEEAAVYYGIGQKRLRNLIANNPSAEYLLTVGNRTQFKRKKFEEFIDSSTCI